MLTGTTSIHRQKPSQLAWLANGARSADRLRRQMARTGFTLAGQRLWSDAEVNLLRRLYPDYRKACIALRGRSRSAVQSKALRLGITRPLQIWSDEELRRLKVSYRHGSSMHEIRMLLPGKTAKQIYHRTAYSGWRRPRKPPKITGLKPYDDVRARAFACRMSMRDLASSSSTGSYFLQRPNRNDWKKIRKAVALLDGNMMVVWPTP